jgi:hypothetical protein
VPHVTFNLTKNSQSSLGLKNPQFLKIHDIDYLSNISTSNEFLYEIVCRICDVSIGSVKLYRQADGDWAPESDPLWRPVAATEEIMGGNYLCSVNDGKLYYKSSLTVGVLNIDPVFVSNDGGGSTFNSAVSSRGSASPVVESTIPGVASSPSKAELLKLAVENTTASAVENFLLTKSEKEEVCVRFIKLITRKQRDIKRN